MKFLPLIFSLVLSVFFLLPTVIWAAPNYSVTPRVIDVDATARDILTETITIENNASHVLNVFPSVNEISLAEGGDITAFQGPTMVERAETVTAWLEITRGEQNLKPGERREIPLTIRIHPNALPGEYHALIGFGNGKNRIEAEKLVKNGQAPGVVVTIRIADTRVEIIDLERFTIEKYVTSEDNTAIEYTLVNPGELSVVPIGEIIFYDTNGKELTAIDANPDMISLQPGEEITLTRTVPTKGLIGKNKAFLNIKYGQGQAASVYDTVFFYVIPWKLLLLIFAFLILFAILITLYLHRKYELSGSGYILDDEPQHVGFKVKEGISDDQHHDINLKPKK